MSAADNRIQGSRVAREPDFNPRPVRPQATIAKPLMSDGDSMSFSTTKQKMVAVEDYQPADFFPAVMQGLKKVVDEVSEWLRQQSMILDAIGSHRREQDKEAAEADSRERREVLEIFEKRQAERQQDKATYQAAETRVSEGQDRAKVVEQASSPASM